MTTDGKKSLQSTTGVSVSVGGNAVGIAIGDGAVGLIETNSKDKQSLPKDNE